MYGISKTAYNGREERFNDVMMRAERCAIAVESLVEIVSQTKGKSSVQLEELSRKATAIVNAYELNGIANEVVFGGAVSAATNTIRDFVSKMVSLITRAVTYFFQLVTELKHTATGLRKRAIALIGAGSSSEYVSNGELMVKDRNLFRQINIGGELPVDLAKEVATVSQLAQNLDRVDFVVALDTMVRDLKSGKDYTQAQESFHQELLSVAASYMKPPTRQAISATKGDGYLPNYTTAPAPGNLMMNMYVPPLERGLNDYSARIVSVKADNNEPAVPALSSKTISSIGREVKSFCEYIINQGTAQARVNNITRDINALARDGKLEELGKVIRPLAKMADTPAITYSRLALTVMVRAVDYCEQSFEKIDKYKGAKNG